MSGKATAIAHPIQGLVKYHGLRDPVRRIPFHASISLCTGPTSTRTTVEVMDEDYGDPTAVFDGEPASGRAMERIATVVNAIQEHAGDDRPFRMESINDFPQKVGLGSSASGFAALAVAAAAAYGHDASPAKLSEYARLGAGSACRAVTGGVSEWVVEGERSYSRPLWNPGDGGALEDWRIVVPLVQHEEPTENVHQEVLTSPLFQGRLDYLPAALDAARAAVREGDLEALAAVAERDTLNLHAVTMTSESSHLTWQPATVAVMRAVWELRDAGTPVHFSMDTGATAYLNTHKDHEEEVAAAVADLPGIADVLRLHPAGPTRLVDDHLF